MHNLGSQPGPTDSEFWGMRSRNLCFLKCVRLVLLQAKVKSTTRDSLDFVSKDSGDPLKALE